MLQIAQSISGCHYLANKIALQAFLSDDAKDGTDFIRRF